MTTPDSESRAAMYRTVTEIRESLIRLADSSCGLNGFAPIQDLLQSASFSLGRAESELLANGVTRNSV
jgi:hypothetical protein